MNQDDAERIVQRLNAIASDQLTLEECRMEARGILAFLVRVAQGTPPFSWEAWLDRQK